jgi:hypothetical protein
MMFCSNKAAERIILQNAKGRRVEFAAITDDICDGSFRDGMRNRDAKHCRLILTQKKTRHRIDEEETVYGWKKQTIPDSSTRNILSLQADRPRSSRQLIILVLPAMTDHSR